MQVVQSQAVLVIGNRLGKSIVDALFQAGLTAVVKDLTVQTFARIRKQRYDATLIDGTDPERDALETVLNIRDYDEDVPVVVLSDGEAPTRGNLLEDKGLHWLERSESPEAIAECVRSAMETAPAGKRRAGI